MNHNLTPMKFKRLTDKQDIDLAQYIKDYVVRVGPVKIQLYVGCDSQNRMDNTIYATTVVLHIGTTGCHVLYRRETLPRIFDFWTRLWGEVERSVEVAIYLQQNGVAVDNVDLDLNSDPAKRSNRLVQAAKGYVESLGINARIKPSMLPAIRAADNIAK